MHNNIKEHKDNDKNKYDKCNNNKYDVNENKHYTAVHTFIVCKNT